MFLLKFFAILISLGSIAQADYNDDQIYDALIILQDIPEDLATNFCQDYVRYQDSTTTCTVTGYPTTVTTTLAPTPCDYSTTPYPPVTSSTTANPTTAPLWSTVSSTTTITYTTTSTIYVPITAPTFYKRSAEHLPQRATWCSDYDLPCRLVQYSYPVIAGACRKYLAGRYGGHVVTSTYTVIPTETEAVAASTCTEEGGYGAPTDAWHDGLVFEPPVTSLFEEPPYETSAPPMPVYDTAGSSQGYQGDYSKPEDGHGYDSTAPYSGAGEDYSRNGSNTSDGDGEYDYEDSGKEKPYPESQDGYSDDAAPYGDEGEDYGGGDEGHDEATGEAEGYPDEQGSYGGEETQYTGGEDGWDNLIAGMDPEYLDAVDADGSENYT